jgi:hypothetical protein
MGWYGLMLLGSEYDQWKAFVNTEMDFEFLEIL